MISTCCSYFLNKQLQLKYKYTNMWHLMSDSLIWLCLMSTLDMWLVCHCPPSLLWLSDFLLHNLHWSLLVSGMFGVVHGHLYLSIPAATLDYYCLRCRWRSIDHRLSEDLVWMKTHLSLLVELNYITEMFYSYYSDVIMVFSESTIEH